MESGSPRGGNNETSEWRVSRSKPGTRNEEEGSEEGMEEDSSIIESEGVSGGWGSLKAEKELEEGRECMQEAAAEWELHQEEASAA